MIVIGRIDKIDLPEFDLFDTEAKVDTGAYGCALHCHNIKIELKNGREVLTFKVLDPSHQDVQDQVYCTNKFSDKVVKNSGGITEHRYTVLTSIILFGKEYEVEFSLADRSSMKYPILLGRQFISKRFLVDVQLKDLSFTKKQMK